jgi:hypothetical protein
VYGEKKSLINHRFHKKTLSVALCSRVPIERAVFFCLCYIFRRSKRSGASSCASGHRRRENFHC